MRTKVDIVVVNWNSGEKTLRAIQPYLEYNSSLISCNVMVVDNGSSDNSKIILRNQIKNLIENNSNAGFAKACNEAFRRSNADYILLLNPDTVSSVEVLENLVQFLQANPAYAIAGPAQVDRNGNLLRSCARFPTFKSALFDVLALSKMFPQYFTPSPLMKDWDHTISKEVDHVMGSYMLIRKSTLDIVGVMDEDYFVYFEDLDLSKRFSNAGFKSYYSNKYSIVHESGGSGEKVEDSRLFYSLSSRHTYWQKHFNKRSNLILTALSITVEPLLRIVDSGINGKNLSLSKILKAYYLYFRKIRRRKIMNTKLNQLFIVGILLSDFANVIRAK